MEHHAIGSAPQLHGIPQGVNGQETVYPAPNPAGDDFSGIEVKNSTDVVEPSANFYVGKVTNPDEMGNFLVKPL